MAIKLADTLAPMADFPAAMAEHIEFSDGESLQKKLDDGTLGSGGEGATYIELSQEEYDALGDDEKVNGSEYRTYDTGHIYKLGVEFGKETDISSKQDNLSQVKFTMRRNSASEGRYCLIGSSDLSQNLLMCEPYRFQGIFGDGTTSVENKSIIDFMVSFREGVGNPDEVLSGFANSSKGFDYVDLLITTDETTNMAYAYVDFKTSGSVATGEITKPVLEAESYMDFAESFELTDTYIGTLVCKMSDYAKIITNIDDTTASSDTVWSSQKTSGEIDALISDTNLTSTTSTLSASKVKNAVTYNFDTQAGSVKYVKFKLHTTTISVVDNYGGKIEILGANNSPSNPNYKTAKVVRLSYGDWNSHDAIQVPSAVHTKIGELYYYSTDEYYYLKLYNYAYFTMTGLATAPEMITSLPVDVSEMTLIPESDWGRISDTASSTTSTYSSAKIDEKIAKHSLPIAFDSGIINNSTVQVYKLANVGYTASGGTDAYNLNLLLSSRGAEEIELIGGKNDGGWIIEAIRNNKSFNKITNIYQDGLDIYVRLDLRCNYFRVYHKSGVLSGDFAVSLVDTVPATATELTVTEYATKKDIDGTTIKTTSTTGSEYYAITFKDKQFERGNNQGILIQHNRLNFEPVTFIFSASSYNTASYERDNYDVTKINGSVYNPTSPYMMHFYMDKANNTLYLSVPSYSGVTLTDLQFKSDVIAYTKVNAIPDTATKITVTEYATKDDLSAKQDDLSARKVYVRRNSSTNKYVLLATIDMRVLTNLGQPLRIKGVIGNMANDITNIDLTINARNGFVKKILYGTVTHKNFLTNDVNIIITKSNDGKTAYVYLDCISVYGYIDAEIYLGSVHYSVPSTFDLVGTIQGTEYTSLLDSNYVVIENVINDTSTGDTTSTWSSSKIASTIDNKFLVGTSAPTTDTCPVGCFYGVYEE